MQTHPHQRGYTTFGVAPFLVEVGISWAVVEKRGIFEDRGSHQTSKHFRTEKYGVKSLHPLLLYPGFTPGTTPKAAFRAQ